MKYIFIINLFGDINVNIFFIINLVKVDAVSSGTLPIIVLSMPWDGGSTMQAIAVPSSVPQQLRVHSALQATVTGLRPPVPFTNHCDASKRFFFCLPSVGFDIVQIGNVILAYISVWSIFKQNIMGSTADC
jgi:hypothetical protein